MTFGKPCFYYRNIWRPQFRFNPQHQVGIQSQVYACNFLYHFQWNGLLNKSLCVSFMNTSQQAQSKWSDSCAFSAFLWLSSTGIVPATQTMFLFRSSHSEFNFRFHFAELRDKHRLPTASESAWLQRRAWKLSRLHPSPWQSPSISHWLAQKSRTSVRPTWPSNYEIISSLAAPLSALVGFHLEWSSECEWNILERVKLCLIRGEKDEKNR